VTLPEDRFENSSLMEFRQRHEGGNDQIKQQIQRHFRLPSKCAAATAVVGGKVQNNDADKGGVKQNDREWDSYLYLTGIQQSQCYSTALNSWRQRSGVPQGRFEGENTVMGVLYWQLNGEQRTSLHHHHRKLMLPPFLSLFFPSFPNFFVSVFFPRFPLTFFFVFCPNYFVLRFSFFLRFLPL
jgi:hypothetical protein